MANTLAYYDMATINAIKSFIVQAPGFFSCGIIKPSIMENWSNYSKLVFFIIVSHFHCLDTSMLAYYSIFTLQIHTVYMIQAPGLKHNFNLVKL